MKIREQKKLIDEATGAMTSETLLNGDSDSTSIQVWGTFADVSLTVQGKSAVDGEFVAIGLIDISTYTIVTNGEVVKGGIYQIGSDALTAIRVIVNSVSGGNVNVTATQVDCAEV